MNSQLKASDLFDRLMPERKQDVKEIKVERSPALDAIVDGFGNVVEAKYPGGYNDKEFYEFCTRHVPDKYSAKDIEYFSILLSDYQSEKYFEDKAGYYLSALVNYCKDKNVTIRTHLTDGLIGLIGCRNEGKHVTVKGNAGYDVGANMKGGAIHVEGNAGDDVGKDMEGGVITVKGNTGNHVGWDMKGGVIKIEDNAGNHVGANMKGGTIHVKGNVGNWVGEYMKDGAISVKGNAGYDVGRYMEGGEIHINGKLKSLAEDIEGGNIYHKGKLVIENGEFV